MCHGCGCCAGLVFFFVCFPPFCKYHTSKDMFPRCKSVHKMATGKSDDELLQHEHEVENSEKWKFQNYPRRGDKAQRERQ